MEDTPSGRLLEGFIEVIDEFYSANLSQDAARGMRENAGSGFCNGGRAPYGYIRVKVQDGDTPRTQLEPEPRTAPIVQRIFRECSRGKGALSNDFVLFTEHFLPLSLDSLLDFCYYRKDVIVYDILILNPNTRIKSLHFYVGY